MKIKCIFHLKEWHALLPISLHFLERFLLILTFFFSPAVSSHCNLPHNLFAGVESLYQPQIAFFLADKNHFQSAKLSPFQTPIALKGMDSKVLTVRPPQPLPPLSSRMHCAMKMMNDLQWGDRVLF